MSKVEKGRQTYKESRRERKKEKRKKMYRILATMPLGISLNSSALLVSFHYEIIFSRANHQALGSSTYFQMDYFFSLASQKVSYN